jgi:hypothetical protein
MGIRHFDQQLGLQVKPVRPSRLTTSKTIKAYESNQQDPTLADETAKGLIFIAALHLPHPRVYCFPIRGGAFFVGGGGAFFV